jgi:hypothetical protein
VARHQYSGHAYDFGSITCSIEEVNPSTQSGSVVAFVLLRNLYNCVEAELICSTCCLVSDA